MDTPVSALKVLKVKYQHEWSCDIDAQVKKTIYANHPPKTWFPDLMTRDNSAAPDIDLYVAGFPCQAFSSAGLMKGFKDKRGKVFYGVCDVIDVKRPSAFILENVKGLLSHDQGRTFDTVLKTLSGIGNGAYTIDWRILNTHDHGVPQNRQRVYFVGIRTDVLHKTAKFTWPEPIERPSIEKFLDRRSRVPTMSDLPPTSSGTAHSNVKAALKDLVKAGSDPLNQPFVIDCDGTAGWGARMEDRTPAMTCGRAAGHWVTNRGRRMRTDEMMRLQGMDEKGFVQDVSDRQLGKQIGNAMSQNVLERIMVTLLPAAGLVPRRCALHDRWQAACKAAAPKKRAAATPEAGSRKKAKTA
ncbi:unnamed protein product [Polarella glacialis]|uniref:DNA (cytosine-5-)-methyltransferase n=1 Tax=Polarella glacialis TaxID=89957 RepID=A0A813HKG5_POLGL|nr:unnamed protein product [Polarella glacialis]